MCGIAGFVLRDRAAEVPLQAVRQMTDLMCARGPDAERVSGEEGIALGHRRLAILDLDPRSHQPMDSPDARYTIIYNGEIYNFRELRRQLEDRGKTFQTTSDTEVILELFAREGERMLPRLRGMFALLIWDRQERRGFVARDPYGIKPLYYAQTADGVILASQVRALLSTGLVSREPDPRGQASFWLLGSVAEPNTWYRDVRVLPAGHFAWIDEGRIASAQRFWDVAESWRSSPAIRLPDAEVRERVREGLRSSVAAHLVADVPVGVFLSGGVDSGALAGLMVEAGASNLQGFTLAFREFAGKHEDEAPVAARVARRYGIEHHVRVVTREEFDADLPRILAAMDQPSIDGVNTWYATKAVAERKFKVVVSGVGGDELFQGYGSFRRLPPLVSTWRRVARVPGAMAVAGAAARFQARRSGNQRWKYAPEWARTMPGAWWLRRGLFSPSDLPSLMGEELAAEALKGFDPRTWIGEMSGLLPEDSRLALAQIESTTYLRNQLLRDSDWASMDHSVELRTPLVDAWLLRELSPLLGNFERFPQKSLLADAPLTPLPEDVAQRRKTGFGIPVDRWATRRVGMFGLRPWAAYLSEIYANG
jgi:asparagine synthase (glutamine-hydrolysing)